MKRRIALLLLGVLLLTTAGLAGGLAWLGLSEAGLQWSFRQLQREIPGEISVTALKGQLLGRVQIRGLEYRSQQIEFEVDEIELEAQMTSLLLGHVDIDQLSLRKLMLRLPAESSRENKPLQLPPIDLPWRISLHRLSVDDLTIQQGETSYAVKSITADVETWLQQVNIHQLQLEAEDYGFDLSGDINLQRYFPHQLKLAWRARLPSDDELRGEASFEGNLQKTKFKQQLLAPSPIRLQGSLSKVIEDLGWQAEVTAEDFDYRQWKLALPEIRGSTRFKGRGSLQTASINGSAELEREDTGPVSAAYQLQWTGDHRIGIQLLELDFQQAAMKLAAQGEWQPGEQGGRVDLALRWQNLHWPLDRAAWFNSAKGQGHIEGGIDDYRFRFQTSSPLAELPESEWQAEGTGSLDRVYFEQLRIDTLEGHIDARGELDWQETLTWRAEVSARNINPGLLYADWSGRLNSEMINSGSLTEGKIDSRLQVKKMDGELRGYPVMLSSRLHWHNDGLDIEGLDFQSSASILKASGRIDQDLTLEWSLDSANLSELLPDGQGQLQASGKLLGSRQQPKILARVNGKNLAYLDYQAVAVDGDIALDPGRWQDLEADVQASMLQVRDIVIDRLKVSATSRGVSIEADVGEYKARVNLIGSGNERGWQGQLRQADLSLDRFNQWSLQKPVAISLQNWDLETQQGCWSNSDAAVFCTDFNGTADDWTSSMRLSALPLEYLQELLPKQVKFDSTLDAAVDLSFGQGQITGKARVELTAGGISYEMQDGELERWTYKSASLQTEFKPQGITSSGQLLLRDSERLQLKLAMPQARLPGINIDSQEIRGQVDARLDDLAFVGLWLPQVRALQGQAAASLMISGTIAKAILNGQFSLQQGQFAIPRLGLNISEISLTGQSQGLERMNYTLSALSGGGRLDIQGVIEHDDKDLWTTRMTLKGSDFEIARIPEAQVQASPDLVIRIKPYHMEISGTVTIPYAHLEPRDVSTAVRVSNDVVIIGAEQPQEKQWAIVSNIQVRLGERVHFFGYGFEGRLSGQMQVEEQTGLPTRATGEINFIDGRYRAYGQRLDIQQGRLIFSGGPLTSPGLDVRAVREINGITVGIRALGPITEPQIELFSSPAMGQTDILSYLLLGRPIENASDEEGKMMAKAALALGLSGGDRLARSLRERFGLDEMRLESSDSGDQASLVIGRYLSPKLYVSYGIGLIEAFNTYIVRYQLSRRWQLKAESGESHSADLIYSIER